MDFGNNERKKPKLSHKVKINYKGLKEWRIGWNENFQREGIKNQEDKNATKK